jgi:hypothetical protein
VAQIGSDTISWIYGPACQLPAAIGMALVRTRRHKQRRLALRALEPPAMIERLLGSELSCAGTPMQLLSRGAGLARRDHFVGINLHNIGGARPRVAVVVDIDIDDVSVGVVIIKAAPTPWSAAHLGVMPAFLSRE